MALLEIFRANKGEYELGVTAIVHQHSVGETKTKWHFHLNVFLVFVILVLNLGSDDVQETVQTKSE